MPTPSRFHWSAQDLQGTKHSGELMARNAKAARSQLQQAGWMGVEIRRVTHRTWRGDRALRQRDITVLTRQLCTLLNADVPLVNALSLIIETTTHAPMLQLIEQLLRDIRGGRSLAQALAEHNRHFDSLYRHVIAAGEASGRLGVLLDRLATQRERQEALRAQLRSAMIYPLTVMLVALSVVVVILVWVVPTFEAVYAGFGAALPALTLGLLSISRATVDHASVGGLGILLILVLGSRVRRSAWASQTWDAWSLHWPVLGEVRRRSATVRWSQTLCTLLEAGTPLSQALVSSAGACGHHRFEQASLAMALAVQQGQSLTAAMKVSRLFAPVVIQLCAMGEASGQLSNTLFQSARLEERALETQLQGLSGLIEPVIIVLLGLIIGTTVLALYWPIFELGQVV